MDLNKQLSAWHLDPEALQLLAKTFSKSVAEDGIAIFGLVLMTWLVVHVLLARRLSSRLIADRPCREDTRREISYSTCTMLVLASLVVLMQGMVESGKAEIYKDPLQHGLAWLLISLPLLLIWQDFYFYCTHRLLHTRWLFKHVHAVHHRSRNPSPWAAYSFHPIEALINGMMLLTAISVVPVNLTVLTAFLLHGIIRNATGHAAYETMPAGFVHHPVLRLLTTTTHHHLHHETARGHYGLWFTWWDRWCGTEREDYLDRFAATSLDSSQRK